MVRKKGQGGVQKIANGYRARKQKKGFPPLLGTTRDTWDEALADLATLDWPDPDAPSCPTLRDFMREQLEGPRKKQVSYGTWQREEIVWRRRVWLSDLGSLPLSEIQTDDCQAFLDSQTKMVPERDADGRAVYVDENDEPVGRDRKGKLIGTNLRQSFVMTDEPLDLPGLKRIGAVLSVYFEAARSRRQGFGFIAVNPMHDVEYPKESRQTKAKRTRHRKSLTPEQAASLGANLLDFITTLRGQGERFEAMVMTQRDTGFRRGELCAIKWSQVRFIRREGVDIHFIALETAIARRRGGLEDDATKTGRMRELPISKEAYERIQRMPRRGPYVFSTESGAPVRPDNYGRSFRAFRDAVGMPGLTSHNLRRTYISLMLKAGVDLKTIQANVGHASPRMIMEVYGETFAGSQIESVDRFLDVLKQAEEQRENGTKSKNEVQKLKRPA